MGFLTLKAMVFLVLTGLLSPAAPAQEVPTDIAKKDLPAKAICVICDEGEERPAAGVMYQGTAYYFCNAGEVKTFKKDPASHVPPVLPRPMPAFKLKAEDGSTWTRETMEGKLVLIDFWATWCKPCIEMMPSIETLRAAYAGEGFEILSVSIDQKRSDLDKFLKTHKFGNPVLHDTARTWSDWGVRAIPATFLVKDGQIVMQWKGKVDEKTLAESIKRHLGK